MLQVKWKTMRKITKYHKCLRAIYIRMALLIIFINILFLPSYTKYEADGENLFKVILNGKDNFLKMRFMEKESVWNLRVDTLTLLTNMK